MRTLLICGKGGTGKSTLSAALALRAAQEGKNTRLLSADPAHSLSLLFGRNDGATHWQAGPRLEVSELAGYQGFRADFPETIAWAQGLLNQEGTSHGFGAELSLLPGVEECWMLRQIQQAQQSREVDCLIVDQAPTAFALRLLSLPTHGAWYAKHAIKAHDRYAAQALVLLPMLVSQGLSVPATVLAELKAYLLAMQGLSACLTDPAVCTAWIVATPDPLAAAEAETLYRLLSLYGVTCERLIINQAQDNTDLAPIATRFQGLAVNALAQAGTPPWNTAGLMALAGQIPLEWFQPCQRRPATEVVREGNGLSVSILLPLVEPQEVDLAKMGDELYITWGVHRRTILLPEEAGVLRTTRAKFAEGRLTVSLA